MVRRVGWIGRMGALALAAAMALPATRSARAQDDPPTEGVLRLVDQIGGIAQAVAAGGGDRAALGAGRRAYVVGIDADGAARVVQRTEVLPAFVRSLAFVGSRLFVAPEGRGIHVYETAGTSIQPLGVISTTREVKAMVPRDGLLYTAEYGRGLVVYDARGALPAAPLAVEGTRRGIVAIDFAGDLLYAAYAPEGLGILDVSQPEAPKLVGRADMRSEGIEAVAVVGQTAYIAAGVMLGVFDVADPAAPALVERLQSTEMMYHDLAAGDGVLYVAGGGGGVVVLDVDAPAAPELVLKLDTKFEARRLALVDDRLLAVDWLSGLTVIDVSTPRVAAPVGRVDDVAGFARSVAATDGRLYVAFARDRVGVIDAATLDPVGSLPIEYDLQEVAVVAGAGLLSVTSVDKGFRLFDLAEPTAPRQLAGLDATMRDIAFLDRANMVASIGRQGMSHWDLTDPANPERTVRTPPKDFMSGLDVDADHVYVADRAGGLVVYGLPPAAGWAPLGKLELEAANAEARDVAVLGPGTVAVAGDRAGLYVVDVSDPAGPALAGHVDSAFEPMVITAHDGLVFAGSHAWNVGVYDAREAAAPRFVGEFVTAGTAASMVWAGDRLVVAAEREGLLVFEVGTIPPPGTAVADPGPPDAGVLPAASPTPGDAAASTPAGASPTPVPLVAVTMAPTASAAGASTDDTTAGPLPLGVIGAIAAGVALLAILLVAVLRLASAPAAPQEPS